MTSQPPASSPDDVLTVEHLDVRLSGRQILQDVTFSIRHGEFTGLIGSNGAGKTTLLRVILGLQAPTSGTVRVPGQARSRRGGLIGYVPQKIVLDPDMPLRARDLVGLGLDGHRLGLPLPSASRRALIDEMLAAVDAERVRRRPGRQPVRWRAAAGDDRARADQPAPAAAARRAAGQPGHRQRAGRGRPCSARWPGSSRSRC